MALKKQFTNPYTKEIHINGYWRVIEINNNILTGDSHIVLAGYSDKAARDNGGLPIEQRSFDFNKDNNPFTLAELDKQGINAVKIAYTTIKSQKTTSTNEAGETVEEPGEFADAVDD